MLNIVIYLLSKMFQDYMFKGQKCVNFVLTSFVTLISSNYFMKSFSIFSTGLKSQI